VARFTVANLTVKHGVSLKLHVLRLDITDFDFLGYFEILNALNSTSDGLALRFLNSNCHHDCCQMMTLYARKDKARYSIIRTD